MPQLTDARQTAAPRGRRTRAPLVLLAVGALASSALYLWWRLFHTIDTDLWLAVPLLVAETIVIGRFALGLASTGPEPGPGVDAATPLEAGQRDAEGASVEVLVVAAGADADSLMRTLALAGVDRPAAVRVLDTFARSEIEEEARRHGATYEVLGTPQAAGLVDLALRSSEAPFVAWLSAGDVPVPGLLGLVHAFDDPDVAVVQSAADLVNRDSLLHLAPDHDEQALENRVAGPSLDRAGAAPWEGSGSLLRVAAIERVGGLRSGAGSATHRVALRLARAGMTIRFCAVPLVRTVAPDSLTDYLDIAERSAHADWALFGSADTPLRPGAGFRRTLSQIHRSTTALDGLVRLTFLSVLTAVLITGRLPFSAAPLAVAGAFAVQFALRSATTWALGRGAIRPGDATRQSLRLMGARVAALFRPAPERSESDVRRWAVLGRLPLLTAALVVIDVALGLRILTLFWPGLLPPFDRGGRFVAMAAAAWAVLAVLDVLHVLVARVQRRLQHRQGSELVVEVDGRPCRSVDLTPAGVGLLLPESLLPASPGEVGLSQGDSVTLRFDVPRLDASTTTVELEARLEHVAAGAADGLHRAGAAFTRVAPAGRDALVEFCALTAEHRERSIRPVEGATPDDYDVAAPGRGRRALAMLSTVGLVVAGPFVALGPDAGAAPADRFGSITGAVLTQDGEPLADACVGVWGGGGTPMVRTDHIGEFTLTSVPEGNQRVFAQDCGGGAHVLTFAPSTPWPGRAEAVPVGGGAQVDGVEIVAWPAGGIMGRVVDEGGAPADGVCLNVEPADVPAAEAGGDRLHLLSTGEAATFNVQVPAGVAMRVQMNDCSPTPRFATSWYPGTTDAAAAKSVEVGTGGALDLGDAVIRSGATVQGRITDSSGASVDRACVSAQDVTRDQWTWVGGANTGPDGTYRFVVPPGTYSIWASDCDGSEDLLPMWYPDALGSTYPPPAVEVAAGDNRFDLSLQPGAVVTGTVTDEKGAGVAGVCVSAQLAHPGEDWRWLGGGSTDADGRYRFLAPEGSSSISAANCDDAGDLVPTWYPDVPMWTQDPPEVGLRVGANDPLDFRVPAGGRLTGTVTDTAGAPATGVCVSLLDAERLRAGEWRSQGWAHAAADGTWRSSPVLPGEYAVHYQNCDDQGRWMEDGEWVPELSDDVYDRSGVDNRELTTVKVGLGANPPVRADLLRAARVKGVVTNGGVPAPGVCVGGPTLREVRTGPDGSYSVGLVPGASTITFSDCESGRGLVQQVRPVELGESEVASIDVETNQAAPASIAGSVRTASGGVLQPACVVAYIPDDLIAVAVVGGDGSYALTGLGAGSYWVGVFGCAEDPAVPMVDPDTGEGYPASWFPGVGIDFPRFGAPDPAADGATPVAVPAGATAEASFCFGGCRETPPTTAAPTTAAPTTAAPTTAAPATGAPTTAPPPTTTAPTTAPAPATVPAPVPGVPNTSPPTVPGTVGPGFARAARAPGAASVPTAAPARPAVTGMGISVDGAVRPGTMGAVVAAASSQMGDDGAPTAADRTGTRQVEEDLGAETSSSRPVATAEQSRSLWRWVGGGFLLLAVLLGLLVVRRRLQATG